MSRHFTLSDSLALDDLQVLLGRAARIEDGAVRVIAVQGVLAVYVPVLSPSGILDATPTVLGLRTFRVDADAAFDVVVPVRSLAAKVEDAQRQVVRGAAPVEVAIPADTSSAAWAAISPPRGGWTEEDPADGSLLASVARAGIDEVAAAIPTGTGEQLVHKVRSEVWGRGIRTLDQVPAGAAFAAVALGFVLGDEEVRTFVTGSWRRLSTDRGHVLVKTRGASLLG